MRFLSLLFNPFAHLIWWIVKTIGGGIDRRLGPLTGWLLAWALVLFSAVSLLGTVYGASDTLLKLAGLREREVVTVTDARVISAETVRRKTLTVEQNIVAEFAGTNGQERLEGNVVKGKSDEYAPGSVIEVFVSKDGQASFRSPEDPFIDAFLVALAMVFPLVALMFSLRYLRYRNQLRPKTEPSIEPNSSSRASMTSMPNQMRSTRSGAPDMAPLAKTDVVVRGRQRVLSYAERQKLDAEVISRMHEKANQKKN
jgi:hypothetical protein